jgi:hypothetical protein
MKTLDKTINIDTSKFTTYAVKRKLEDILLEIYGDNLHKERYVEQSWSDNPQVLFLYYSDMKHVATWNSNKRGGWIFC